MYTKQIFGYQVMQSDFCMCPIFADRKTASDYAMRLIKRGLNCISIRIEYFN